MQCVCPLVSIMATVLNQPDRPVKTEKKPQNRSSIFLHPVTVYPVLYKGRLLLSGLLLGFIFSQHSSRSCSLPSWCICIPLFVCPHPSPSRVQEVQDTASFLWLCNVLSSWSPSSPSPSRPPWQVPHERHKQNCPHSHPNSRSR